jgi:hypothetical protein
VTRISGESAARLASFDGSPRGIAVDGQQVYLATTSRLLAAPRQPGPGGSQKVSELAAGASYANAVLDGRGWLYATARTDRTARHVIVRVKTTGSPVETVARDVRDAPIALHEGALYWFDAERPLLLASSEGSPPRTVSDHPSFERPGALAVDDDGAFVATGDGEDSRILVVPLK